MLNNTSNLQNKLTRIKSEIQSDIAKKRLDDSIQGLKDIENALHWQDYEWLVVNFERLKALFQLVLDLFKRRAIA